MKLSEHFDSSEFERDGAQMPQECVSAFTSLCLNILEPIRAHVGQPLVITSGYRSPEENQEAHGVSNSQHVAAKDHCATDWKILGQADLRDVFDWIRLESGLQCDQVILEHGSDHDVIHVSWVIEGPRMMAMEGATANQSAYTKWGYSSEQELA